MSIRLIASVVIAALLMTGGAATAGQVTEYGVHPAKEQQTTLTKEEAKAIALNHAGLTENEVTGLRIEYDVERGTAQWEVDFHSGDWEYDYEINAETGAVIKDKKEYEPAKTVKPTQTATEKPTAEKPAQTPQPNAEAPKTEKLTAEEAKAIALKHAGLTEADVKWERSEYDVERGVQEWEIDFRSGDWEYDYAINAETGDVIKGEKEYDPVKAQKPTQPAETQPQNTEPPKTETSDTKKLTADEAKSIALSHAGLQESQVKGLRAKYDVDDRIPEWDVEFYADGMEYDYEIHAETGKIRSWDKERDD